MPNPSPRTSPKKPARLVTKQPKTTLWKTIPSNQSAGSGDITQQEKTEAQNNPIADAAADNTRRNQPGRENQGQATGSAKWQALLATVSARLKVPIKRIVRYTGEPCHYRLETELGSVQLGGVENLIGQSKLRLHIADATGRCIPLVKANAWTSIAQALLDCCEVVSRGIDATASGAMTEWLRFYLAEKSVHNSLAEADEGREPFWDGNVVCIFTGDFRRWLQIRQNERIAQNKLTADLRTFGAEPKIVYLTVKDTRTSRSVWTLPAGAWNPDNRWVEAS
jgi:hypothetical protein